MNFNFNRSPLEQAFQKKVIEFVRKTFREEAWGFNLPTPPRRGIPDVILCIKGRTVCLELKREDGSGRASGSQKCEIRKIRKAGGYAKLCDDFEDAKKFLTDIYKNN